MDSIFSYNHPSSDARVIIWEIESPQDELSINKDINISPSLPLLSIQFHLRARERYWYRPPHDPPQFQYHRVLLANSLLEFHPLVYMSYDIFYHAMQEKLENWSEEFENNYRRVIIHDMIGKVHEIVDDESNKNRKNLEMYVGVTLTVDCFLDENILSDDCVICLEELGKRKLKCTACSHVFHGDCIAKWKENGLSCPICRYDL